MEIKEVYELVLYDLTHSKEVKNIKTFKANIHNFSKDELTKIANTIDSNIYLGQSGVDDLAWLRLKKLIQIALDKV